MPEVPLGTAQRLDQCRVARVVAVCRAALAHLFEVLYPHGNVKPIEDAPTGVTKAELGRPYGISAVREKRDRLIRLNTFSQEEILHAIGRPMLQLVHVGKAVAATLIPHGLPDYHFKPTVLAALASRQSKVAAVDANGAHRAPVPDIGQTGARSVFPLLPGIGSRFRFQPATDR
ncbi:hypothetical protein D3C72_1730670 [compost metagenome]